MKRILSILVGLAFPFIMQAGYYNYSPTEVQEFTLTDTSYGDDYEYTIEISQRGKNGSWYNSTSTIYLTPKTHSFAGTFTIEDGTLSTESYVYYSGAKRKFISGDNNWSTDNKTTLSITANGDGTYTFGGAVICKNGSNIYRYLFSDYVYDPFSSEPAKGNVSVTAENITAYDYTSSDGYVELDLNSTDGPYAALAFINSTFNIPAGTYSLNDSGAVGTFAASTGMDGYYAIPSYVEALGWPAEDYFLQSGTITVSYSNGNMNVSGTATSAHGSTITISASGKSPFQNVGPETYTLDVTSVTAAAGKYPSGNPYFSYDVKAKNGEADCNWMILVNTAELTGTFGYTDLGTCYSGSMYIDGTDKDNTVTVAATGNTDEYKLNVRISADDGNIYVINDAVFTYTPPAPESPFENEPEASNFSVSFPSTPYVYTEGGLVTLEFHNGEWDTIVIPFNVAKASDILPGHYEITGTNAVGTVAASTGRQEVGGLLSDTPCLYTKSLGLSDYAPYYVTGGWFDVKYRNASLINICGELHTAKGSVITVDMEGSCTEINERPLPENVMNGLIAGTDGDTYMFAYDAATDAAGHVVVSGTAFTTKAIDGLKFQATYNGESYDMTFDSNSGNWTFTTPDKPAKGTRVSIRIAIDSTAGHTVSRCVEYVVE